MTLRDVMTVLDTIAPFDTAEEWDNAGLQVGDPSVEVMSVLVALDPSIEVISRAGRLKIDLIVTHHPLMIKPIPRLDLSADTARKIGMLIREGISLVSMHTNLDKSPGGVADELASRLDLHGITPYGALRVGTLGMPTPLNHWCRGLSFSGARICNAGKDVYRVAACPGSGMDYWQQARDLGCDTIVTGDVRYHAGIDAVEAGMNVVDLGHFGTEEIIVKPLATRLRKELKRVAVRAHRGRDVFSSL